ncbi:MAG: DEAD/DEAH box helicase, partial [Clostridia bacterium]|nr:DEAD/DEAH box helicase [Clostridia bacterium]
MSIFESGLAGLDTLQAIVKDLSAGRSPVMLTGTGHIHKILLTHALAARLGRKAFFVVADEAEATRVCEDLAALGENALFLPAREISLRQIDAASREYEQLRLGVLSRMVTGDYSVIVATVDALIGYTVPPELLRDRTIRLVRDNPLPVRDLPSALAAIGYSRCDQIEGAGQYAVRGGTIDVYPAQNASPIRIELWGDTVDTISFFDILSQRRTDPLPSIDIPPAGEIFSENAEELASRITALADSLTGKRAAIVRENLLQDVDRLRGGAPLSAVDRYLPLIYPDCATALDYAPDALIVVSENAKVRERLRTADWQLQEDIRALLEEGLLCKELCRYQMDAEDLSRRLEQHPTVFMETFARSNTDATVRSLHTLTCRQLPVWSGSIALLCEDLQDALSRHMACIVLAGAEEKNAQTLAEDLQKQGIPALYAPAPEKPLRDRVLVLRGGLSAGAEFPDAGLTVITHGRINTTRRKRRHVRHAGAEIHSLSELTVGDYIVHAAHGIGLYQGIHQLQVQGVVKDYLKLQYDKGDTLYVPVTQLDLVSKYIGNKEDVNVRLHRLGGQEWQKTKARVRTAVKDIAKDLIQLYSQRMATPGFAFEPDSEWQYDFERHVEFEETEDQLRCIDEIKADMERPVPMDRLLCGDVGFGKTEVALRAAFKCVSQSKQCVLLVPTTILAFQHYNTLVKRFDGFPVQIEMLSRFRTPKQQERILQDLASGKLDIVVGTHRMLSKDVKFRNLGLFIVDEEQRFGVQQKERIKELAPQVDVLTLSATPIPRTLNMAMSGIRDMSIIEEAPQDRRPVQTYVLEHDNGIIADAIRRELRRGGQVYYVHNRTDSIERCAAGLQMRIPEARIAFAHGKMSEEEMSDIWRQV